MSEIGNPILPKHLFSYGNVSSGNLISEKTKTRIDYVDLMKGLTILWIIWIHTYHPDFGNYRNPVFFFASGIFFKLSDAKTFFAKRIWLILVPFFFFYFSSVPFRYLIDLWDSRNFSYFDWNRLNEFLHIKPKWDYLTLNVPLWFLLTLFWIQLYSFVIFRLPRTIIFITAIFSLCFMEELNTQFATPFMINNAFAWYGFFAIGYLIGKPIINYLNTTKRKVFVFIATTLFVIGCVCFEGLEIYDWQNMLGKTKLIVFIVAFLTFFSFFNGWKKLDILRFFGKNSLIVLGAHLWILIPIQRIFFKLYPIQSPWLGFIAAVICAIILIPVINWLNKFLPYLVGKKKIAPNSRTIIKS